MFGVSLETGWTQQEMDSRYPRRSIFGASLTRAGYCPRASGNVSTKHPSALTQFFILPNRIFLWRPSQYVSHMTVYITVGFGATGTDAQRSNWGQ
jgi:hypothetical protein